MSRHGFTSALIALTAFSVTATASAADLVGSNNAGLVKTSVQMPATYTNAINVNLNKTKVLRLAESAATVIIGNPDIADVSVHSGNTLFLLGRGYGNTNLIVLNKKGQTVLDSDIQVLQPASANNVRVYNGTQASRFSYNCAPLCQPSPVLGDDQQYMSVVANTGPAISNQTAGGNSVAGADLLGLGRTGAIVGNAGAASSIREER